MNESSTNLTNSELSPPINPTTGISRTMDNLSPNRTQRNTWKWFLCILLLGATTLNYLDRVAMNQLSSRIRDAFSLSNEQYGWLEGVFVAAFGIGAILVGFLIDRLPLYFIYPIMVIGWSCSGFFTGYADSFVFLMICRFFLGFFEAGNWPCGVVTIRRALPPEERALGNGLFQGGTAFGAILTPLIILFCLAWIDPYLHVREGLCLLGSNFVLQVIPPEDSIWRFPFRVIGLLGFIWPLFWFLLIRKERIALPQVDNAKNANSAPMFRQVCLDRRFWILTFLVIAINTSWHSFRVWLPQLLQKERGFTETEMMRFSSLYYFAADCGSISLGFLTLYLSRRGHSLAKTRVRMFAIGALATSFSILVPWLNNDFFLQIVLLIIAFGCLGVFSTYFALSQEVTSIHQGKLTGLLGLFNSIYLTILFPFQGFLIDQIHSYALCICLSGLFPLVGVVVLHYCWPWGRTDV